MCWKGRTPGRNSSRCPARTSGTPNSPGEPSARIGSRGPPPAGSRHRSAPAARRSHVQRTAAFRAISRERATARRLCRLRCDRRATRPSGSRRRQRVALSALRSTRPQAALLRVHNGAAEGAWLNRIIASGYGPGQTRVAPRLLLDIRAGALQKVGDAERGRPLRHVLPIHPRVHRQHSADIHPL